MSAIPALSSLLDNVSFCRTLQVSSLQSTKPEGLLDFRWIDVVDFYQHQRMDSDQEVFWITLNNGSEVFYVEVGRAAGSSFDVITGYEQSC